MLFGINGGYFPAICRVYLSCASHSAHKKVRSFSRQLNDPSDEKLEIVCLCLVLKYWERLNMALSDHSMCLLCVYFCHDQVLLMLTVPDVRRGVPDQESGKIDKEGERFWWWGHSLFFITFIMSILWIGVYSYFMVSRVFLRIEKIICRN